MFLFELADKEDKPLPACCRPLARALRTGGRAPARRVRDGDEHALRHPRREPARPTPPTPRRRAKGGTLDHRHPVTRPHAVSTPVTRPDSQPVRQAARPWDAREEPPGEAAMSNAGDHDANPASASMALSSTPAEALERRRIARRRACCLDIRRSYRRSRT